VAVLLVQLLAGAVQASAEPLPGPIGTTTSVSIAAVGDVLMHVAVKNSAVDHRREGDEEGFGWLWAPIADLLAATDLTFANLETPVAPRTGRETRSFVFNADPAAIVALRRSGVNVVSVANNHILDQGRPGLEETVSELDRLGIPYVGAGEAGHEAGPRLVTVRGIRIAFLAYSRFFNQAGNDCPPGARRCVKASLLDPERAVADVRAAAAEADAVVVSVHWGDEYAQQPRTDDIALAHRMVDAGALIVLGHHPHVLQPVELYRRADGTTGLIAYSLGNFVSNQSRNYVHAVTPGQIGATRDGILLRTEIARRDYGRGITRVELTGAGWLPLWTENDTPDPARRAMSRRPAIRVVSLDRALAEVRAELRALPDPLPRGEQARYVALRQREELYVARRAAIAAAVGEDLQREAPPGPVPAAPRAAPNAGVTVPAVPPAPLSPAASRP
jgi:poly-gamma-glutamate synthesis protein (capsule biosynthesis protein)